MSERIFHVGVKGILVHNEKALILQADSPTHGKYWDFPGGRVQASESLTDALLREVSEEVPSFTNISIESLVHGARLALLNQSDVGLVLFFFKIAADFEEIALSEEHVGYRWVSQNEIPELEQDSIVRLSPEAEGAALKAVFTTI